MTMLDRTPSVDPDLGIEVVEAYVRETEPIRVPALTSDGDDYLSFRLNPVFVANYADTPVNWGFPVGGGLSLGEITFITKYSQLKADGTKERWHEACERVISGMYSIQKNHTLGNMISWSDESAERSAEEAYQRMFDMKWTPPGRGIDKMGTKFVMTFGSASLQNCSFWTTKNLDTNPYLPFVRLMEESMLGIGVGFDTEGAGKVTLNDPTGPALTWVIPDSREGWCESVRVLLESYFTPGQPAWVFDYSKLRPAGAPLRTFGGTASGPDPLRNLHEIVARLLGGRDGEKITSRDIVDLMNLIGQAVVAGAKRRSAEIALGSPLDDDYINLKNWEMLPNTERTAPGTGWAWTSNNSVITDIHTPLGHLVESMVVNGEPGIVFLDLLQNYGRLVDGEQPGIDARVDGVNPCAEMGLEGGGEKCTLAEIHMNRAESLADFLRTIKFAFLYAKTVTLLSTHWADVNAIMSRNRRIGVGLTGVAQFVEANGLAELRRWQNAGYEEIRRWDKIYSEWLCVRESVKVTTVKPSGSTSLLSGATAGVHWPVRSGRFLRTMRLHRTNDMLSLLQQCGFHVEPDETAPETGVIVSFATDGPEMRDQFEVSLWEKANLAAELQHGWSDNAVSVTLTFQEHERRDVGRVIEAFTGRLKTMSFLPISDEGIVYAQAPYQPITDERFDKMRRNLSRVPTEMLYASGLAAEGSKFCDGDTCEL